jgi:hypothetical protein
VTVKLRVSVDLKALTIEEMVGKRKRIQVLLPTSVTTSVSVMIPSNCAFVHLLM